MENDIKDNDTSETPPQKGQKNETSAESSSAGIEVPHEHGHEHKHKSKHEKIDKYEKKILELEMQLAEKSKSVAELHDKWLRLHAEFDNFRKRIHKEKAEWRDFAQEEVIDEILPVLDNLDRALAASVANANTTSNTLAEGIRMVHKQLEDILGKHNVVPIDCIGKPFDPHFHEAVMTIPSEEYPEDTIVEEIQKGYQHNDRVIRPSMVKVSKKPTIKELSA